MAVDKKHRISGKTTEKMLPNLQAQPKHSAIQGFATYRFSAFTLKMTWTAGTEPTPFPELTPSKDLRPRRLCSLKIPLTSYGKSRREEVLCGLWMLGANRSQSKNSKKKGWDNYTARVSILVGPDEEKACARYKGCLDITQHHSDCLHWNT